MATAHDYTGVKLGLLTLVKRVGTGKWGSALWEYKCDCGNKGEITVPCFKLVLHHSCGCNSKFNKNPRVKNHTLLKAFYSMHKRCYDCNDAGYSNYGGRGVKVCDRWHDFNNYYDDVIPTWKKGLWADRTDFNGNYEPSNFRWVTPTQSGRNTREVRLDEEKVKFIRNSDLTTQELSVMFSVHWQTVKNARVGKTWK